MPLSETANRTPILSFVAPAGLTFNATPPCSVNLVALSTRFSNAALRRTGSPMTKAGSCSEISTRDCRPLAVARPASESPTLRAKARRSKKSWRTPPSERPLLAASTNRVARLARCSAPALMVSTHRRSRSLRSDVANRSLMARIPVSGVRTSWANVASAVSTMPAAAGLAAVRRVFLAAELAAFFLGRAFFGRRVVRPRRGFDTMIPPT